MEFIVRSGSSVNSRRDGQLGEYLYRMSVRILIIATFHGVIQVLKLLPCIRDTGELQISGVPDARESIFSSVDTGESNIPGVPDTGDLFF